MDLAQEFGNNGIVLFDGVCNMCNSSVQFIIKHDKKDFFRFAPLQGETAKLLLASAGLPKDYLATIVYFKNGKVYKQSSAVLRVFKSLGGGWALLFGFIIIPAPVRDFFYRLIASNRYKFFGKKEACMVPTKELRKKFI